MVLGVWAFLFLVAVFSVVLNVPLVEGSGTIYIRGDGSIDPPTAPIQRDGNIYTFTDNIYEEIVIERSNIVIDGNGSTLQGTGSGNGFYLYSVSNVTIKRTNIRSFSIGVRFNLASNNVLFGNNITDTWNGVSNWNHWLGTSYNTILGNNLTNNHNRGIDLYDSSYNTISENNIVNSGGGVTFHGSSSYNTISGNNITDNQIDGISDQGTSSNNTISNNNIKNNGEGIALFSSSDCTIFENNITNNNWFGIYLHYSPDTVLRNNTMVSNVYNFGVGGDDVKDFVQDVDSSSTVDGKPIFYLINQSNLAINPTTYPNIGYLALINSFNITVEGLVLESNGQGVLSVNTTNSKVENNNIAQNAFGIEYWYSSTNVISENNITSNERGLYLEHSPNNIIFRNNIENSDLGGVGIWGSDNNVISENNIIDNSIEAFSSGIYCASSNNTISKNNITNNGRSGISVDGELNTISENSITHNEDGIYVIGEANVFSKNNIMNNSGSGISLYSRRASFNILSGNNVTGNEYGINLHGYPGYPLPSSNKIYHNNLMGNIQQAYGYDSTNTWDNSYSSGGNHWSDYTGEDKKSGPNQDQDGGDGIGDTSYVISSDNQDRYPLMSPWPSGPGLHELEVILEAPTRLSPGNSALLESTISNNGFYNEENVTFFLFVNHTIVNSTKISSLEADSSYTISYLWTPTIEGLANITAYAIPVPEETYINNNFETVFVRISSTPPVHNIDTDLFYDTIQEAIDAPETLDRHTIKAEAGTYYEHLTVSKSVEIIGENRANTIIDGSNVGTFLIHITANNVALSGFTIQNSNTAPTPAVRLYSSSNIISNNTIINNGWGIYTFGVSNNTIQNNIVTNNVYGIYLEWVTTHTVRNNTIANHQEAGTYLRESRNNVFTSNIIEDNKDGVILVGDSSDNKVYHNNFIDNTSPGFAVNSDNNFLDDGYPHGGNYWSDYTGVDLYSGTFQNEMSNDGVGDTPYIFDWSNQDRYPLMNPVGTPQPPIANFTYIPEHPVIDQTITFEASTSYDRDNNIAAYRWNFGDGNITTVTIPTITHVYSATGTYTVNLTITDNDGLSHSTTKSITVTADTTPPTSLDDYDGSWYTTDFTISLTATDDMSGVAETYYTINDGLTKTISAHGQPLITTEGAHNKLEYWSVDNVGNEELPHKTLPGIKLDKTTPTGSITINNDATYATSTSVTLTLTSNDATSGIYQVRYSNDGVWDSEPWEIPLPTRIWTLASGDEAKTVYYQIRDNAGLVSQTYSDAVVLDMTPPTGSILISPDTTYTTNITVKLNLSATDATSGIAEMRFSNDNTTYTEWHPYATYKLWTLQEGGGVKTVYAQFKNHAGLISTCYDTIILDLTPPTGSITIAGDAAYINSLSITLTLSATDSTSDVAQMRFSNDNISWTPWEAYSNSKTWALTANDGTKIVYYQIKDNAGLTSPIYEDTITLDSTKPTASAGIDQTVNEDSLATFDGSDSQDENGIQSYLWTFIDVTPQSLTDKNPKYTFATPGTFIITLEVADPGGNVATDTVIITVSDITKPFANAGQDQTVNRGTAVFFDASSSTDNVGIVSFEWDFGDSTRGTGKTTTYVYSNPGTYTVTLTVKDAANNSAADVLTITVHTAGPPAQLPTETFPVWIVGAIIAIIGIAAMATLLLRKRK